MKKVDPKILEEMAKQKNIDKDKIEQIADNYKGKSENELIDELIKIGKTLEGKEEVISKFKAFLDDNQRKKLDSIMSKISEAEVKDKLENKKTKSKKTSSSSKSNSIDTTPSKNVVPKTKKVKKIVKKTKKSPHK
ncbi:MAG: hypothetical protein ACRDD7_09610 [Peptostreptococcaceae bacterium]